MVNDGENAFKKYFDEKLYSLLGSARQFVFPFQFVFVNFCRGAATWQRLVGGWSIETSLACRLMID